MEQNRNKQVNYKHLREISQAADENPAFFTNRLSEAMIKYTNTNPNSPEGLILLHLHFISQSYPDICEKLQKLANGPQTLPKKLTDLAFKVFNN